MSRLRVLKILVYPVCLADDGALRELRVDPIEVPYPAWAAFDLETALGPLRAQVEGGGP